MIERMRCEFVIYGERIYEAHERVENGFHQHDAGFQIPTEAPTPLVVQVAELGGLCGKYEVRSGHAGEALVLAGRFGRWLATQKSAPDPFESGTYELIPDYILHGDRTFQAFSEKDSEQGFAECCEGYIIPKTASRLILARTADGYKAIVGRTGTQRAISLTTRFEVWLMARPQGSTTFVGSSETHCFTQGIQGPTGPRGASAPAGAQGAYVITAAVIPPPAQAAPPPLTCWFCDKPNIDEDGIHRSCGSSVHAYGARIHVQRLQVGGLVDCPETRCESLRFVDAQKQARRAEIAVKVGYRTSLDNCHRARPSLSEQRSTVEEIPLVGSTPHYEWP